MGHVSGNRERKRSQQCRVRLFFFFFLQTRKNTPTFLNYEDDLFLILLNVIVQCAFKILLS